MSNRSKCIIVLFKGDKSTNFHSLIRELQVGTTNRKDNGEVCLLWVTGSASQEAMLSVYLLLICHYMQFRFPD